MNLHLLYIDPGTGSMLFSILIGIASLGYFLFRALIIKLKVVFSGGAAAKTGSATPYVIYCEGRQYWNVFKPVADEFEKRQIDVLYLTSADDDPVFENNYKYIKAEYIGEGNKAYARLNMLSADFVLMTTPGLQVYQLKRSKMVKHYSHILHMPSDAVTYRLFGLDYFDSILLTGSYQADDIRRLEKLRGLPEKKLITVGCTYLDVYEKNIKHITVEENHVFTVLVSPSWGQSALLSKFGTKLLDPLAESGFRIIVRPHPQSKKSELSMLDTLTSKYKDNSRVEWDYERENIYSLSKADIMISDFSGIVFDYVFLFDKPVIYVQQGMDLRPYDADDIYTKPEDLWQFRTLKEIGIELKETDFNNIVGVIKNASDSAELKQARIRAKEAAWEAHGESGKRVVDFILMPQA
ncbi:CDP-glycerol glycerophosphotransferase [Spirochaetia bacterium]|nr:CDP-glycerol glycerophosphotransferase [Spirochaetia bacterium]